MAKEKREVIQEENASWLATFGDLATLLFTFYCLIYASCTYRPGDWETAKSAALEKMLSVLAGGSKMSLVEGQGDGPMTGQNGVIPLFASGSEMAEEERSRMSDRIEEASALMPEKGGIELEGTESGIVFRIGDAIVFPSGSVTPAPRTMPFLAAVAALIRVRPAEVTVVGHTCDLPTYSLRYPSNWELSGFRAAAVARELIREGLGDSSLKIRAAGEHYSRVPNLDEESRRLNRRVEIRVDFPELIGE